MDPGDHVRLGDALEQVPGVGDGDGTDEQPSGPKVPAGLLAAQHPSSAM